MNNLRILGVMTGTSCDGLDAVCLEFDREGWELLWSSKSSYPSHLRKRVLELQDPGKKATMKEWLEINRDLGQWYGTVIKKMIQDNSPAPDVIANHGQTLFHLPAPNGKGLTLQMGDAAKIAVSTGVTVISQFRNGDIAAGGQGAPLVPLFHRLISEILGHQDGGVAIHNLGGVSNITYVGRGGELLAFDTGPGNMWIDAASTIVSKGKLTHDKDGTLSRKGKIELRAVTAVLKHPYFSKAIPKSTGRNELPYSFFAKRTKAKGESLVATAVAVTVESIARSYERWIIGKGLPLKKIYLCGGGAFNPTLVSMLKSRLPDTEILKLDDFDFDSQLIEAQAFAFFGLLTLLGQPIGGKWTGAMTFGPPGQIVPGKNWNEVAAKVQAFFTKSPR